MFIYNTLENTTLEKLHQAFVAAFSDYQVKMDIPVSKLQNMLLRRGYVAGASIGASMGTSTSDVLVGFLLNGVRNWEGKLTAYDTGTAVIRDFRHQGITSSMFQQALKILDSLKVEQYLLEVIRTNTSAVQLYKKLGFEVTREFDCFSMEKVSHKLKSDKFSLDKTGVDKFNLDTKMDMVGLDNIYLMEVSVDKIDNEMWKSLQYFWDFNPSWQNSIDSINAVPNSFACYIAKSGSQIIGYGVLDKKTGDIPQIAVDKFYRRKGIGGSMLSYMMNGTEADKISVLNVDSQCESLKGFMLNEGFEPNVSQYEMLYPLDRHSANN